jgi:hypothetical protein
MTKPRPDSIDARIRSRIEEQGRGAVFVPSDFLDLGSRAAIDLVLHRLERAGKVRRLARGVYDYPQEHPMLGPLFPSVEQIARALAGRDRTRLHPTGAVAANTLGLSEQVPAQAVFLTDGPSRRVQVEPAQTIELRHTTPKNMAAAGRLSGLVIHALRWLGRDVVGAPQITHLKRTLPAEQRCLLLHDLRLAPTWMQPILRELATETVCS